MNAKHHPNWWLMYLVMPVMVALLVLAHNEATSDIAEMIMQLVVVILTFGGLLWWVNANQGAIVREQIDEQTVARQPDWTPLPASRRSMVTPESKEALEFDEEPDTVSLVTFAVGQK
jgi:hypothetical protein